MHHQILAEFRPDMRRILVEATGGGGDGGQDVVIDLDGLGRVAGLFGRVGDDHGEAFAHETRLLDRHDPARGLVHGLAGAVHIIGLVDHDAHAGVHEVLAGKDGDHALHGPGGECVDGHDLRIGVGRAHEGGVDLGLEIDVVRELPAAGQEAHIFLATNRLTYAKLTHSLAPSLLATHRPRGYRSAIKPFEGLAARGPWRPRPKDGAT